MKMVTQEIVSPKVRLRVRRIQGQSGGAVSVCSVVVSLPLSFHESCRSVSVQNGHLGAQRYDFIVHIDCLEVALISKVLIGLKLGQNQH
jgi:hypothetical protein